MTYFLLFYEFFKTGLFSIGGGLATLPFLYDIADRYTWFNYRDIADMIAISESTPGPIGINMATYAGYHAGGILGGIIATLGLAAPSIIITIIVVRILTGFKDNKYVKAAFYGLRPAVMGLIAAAGLGVGVIALFPSGAALSISAILLFCVLFFLIRYTKIHPIIFIFAAALIGAIISM